MIMERKAYAGIDYGMGKANVDHENNIRYGVISQNEVLQVWADSSEPYYPKPEDVGDLECPDCGKKITIPAGKEWGDMIIHEIEDDGCGEEVEIEMPDFMEASGYYIDDEEYQAQCGDDGDIFIIKSKYYTFAQFCSPCAPGAGYLMNPYRIPPEYAETYRTLRDISPTTASMLYHILAERDGYPKVYCFNHDFFPDVVNGKNPTRQCDYCTGTGLRLKVDIPNYSDDKEGFVQVEGRPECVKCWACEGKGDVSNWIHKAPYPVWTVADGEEVEPIKG
jgi:hypothetical protein